MVPTTEVMSRPSLPLTPTRSSSTLGGGGAFPAVLSTGSALIIVAWIAQTFLQLVLLPVIIVGQNIQSKAADKRADQTYLDAEAVLHECLQIQAHLTAQDTAQREQITEIKELLAQVANGR